MLAIINGGKKKAIERKATVDWRMIGNDIEGYLAQAGANWRSAFLPVIQGVVTDRGKQLSTDFGMAFNVQNLYARDWFNNYTLKFAQPIIDTTRDSTAKILALAEAEGWSVPTMQKHLTQTFEQWMGGDVDPDTFSWLQDRLPPYRTEMIARTETIRASNAGSVEIYKDWGVQEHEWLATLDDRVRDEHAAANGQVVQVGQPFSVGGESLLFPGDPAGRPENTINCRCTTIPVIKQDMQPTAPTMPIPEEIPVTFFDKIPDKLFENFGFQRADEETRARFRDAVASIPQKVKKLWKGGDTNIVLATGDGWMGKHQTNWIIIGREWSGDAQRDIMQHEFVHHIVNQKDIYRSLTRYKPNALFDHAQESMGGLLGQLDEDLTMVLSGFDENRSIWMNNLKFASGLSEAELEVKIGIAERFLMELGLWP